MSTQNTTLPPLPASPIAGEFASWCRSKGSTAKACDDANTWIRDAFNAGAAIAAQAPQTDSTESLRKMLAAANESDSSRWEVGFRNIVAILYGPRHKFEIADVVERVRQQAQQAQGVPADYLMADGKTTLKEYLSRSVEPIAGTDEWTHGYEECKRRLFKIIKDQVLAAAPQAEPLPEREPIPRVLFDGFTVLQALDPKAKARTSSENVSDVLDAVVKIMRASACKCNGTGWVCENHDSKPWGDGPGECKCGAGKPCPCNPAAKVEWDSVIASSEQSALAGIGTKGGE